MLTAALIACASPALSDEAGLLGAWRMWLDRIGAERSTIATIRQGRVTSVAGIGMSGEAPRPVMSLSKTITGACVMALVGQGRLNLDDRLSDLLLDRPDLLAKDTAAGRITVRALLTHSSGLAPDSTQSLFSEFLLGLPETMAIVTQRALARPVRKPDFHYNNENYAVLHFVIQAATGQTSDIVCPSLVFDKRITARPHPRFGVGLTYAGWEMTARDLAIFGAGLRANTDWPTTSIGYGAAYGPGVEFVPGDKFGALWHLGHLCNDWHQDVSTIMVSYPDELTVAVTVDGCLLEDEITSFYAEVVDQWYWRKKLVFVPY